ncbi:MAG: hypothetical protein WAU95_01110, partial [Anaerolineae bacterium]
MARHVDAAAGVQSADDCHIRFAERFRRHQNLKIQLERLGRAAGTHQRQIGQLHIGEIQAGLEAQAD